MICFKYGYWVSLRASPGYSLSRLDINFYKKDCLVYPSLVVYEDGEKIKPLADESFSVWWSESKLSFSENVTTTTPALAAPI